MENKIICRNAAEIGSYIGVDKRTIPRYKKDYDLPVWRFEPGGNWKALKPSLDEWLLKMEKIHLDDE